MKQRDEYIQLDHGGGGRMARRLVEEIVDEYFSNDNINYLDDSAVIFHEEGRLAFTTDSFVVSPLFFPGGDIGRIAVCGTVNDLSVTGARPLALSCALIIEEGLPVVDLRRVLSSMRDTLAEAGVSVVTGDTKVVEKGAANGLFINTAGVGKIPEHVTMGMEKIAGGDTVIVTGTIGDHGTAIMAARNELNLETTLESDCMPINRLTDAVLAAAPETRFMRDPTRGGLSAALNDIAIATGKGVLISEDSVPVKPEVNGICDMLGLDILYLANEGKAVAIVPAKDAPGVLDVIKGIKGGEDAAVIGEITEKNPGKVVMRTGIGGNRIVAYPEKDQLPRIC